MKRDPAKLREWQIRSQKARYERQLEKHGHKRFRSLGSKRRTKAERAEKFRREYGSKERVRWVQSLPCVFCGRRPCENAHVTNEGMGRKAHYSMTVPACSDRQGPHGLVRGCHWEMDRGIGKRAMERKYQVDLYAEAERVEKAWRER